MRVHHRFSDAFGGGRVRFDYGVNDRHDAAGFGGLGSLWADIDNSGFPLLKASVESKARGYQRFLGWIQVVELIQGGKVQNVVDVIPTAIGQGVPFAMLGHLPDFFDSPSTHPRVPTSFKADLFLCRPPLLDRKSPIAPLLGVSWGYRITDPKLKPELLPLRRASASAWPSAARLLRRSYPAWRYAP